MAKQTINIGTVANDGTGDTLRNAFDKSNDNFTELYSSGAALPGTQVKLVYISANVRWEYTDGTVPTLTGRTFSITWEGTAAQIPAQGVGDSDFQVGDTALVRATTL